MRQVAASAPELSGKAAQRADAALAARRAPEPLDRAAARVQFAQMMGQRVDERVARA
jgi:beta-N-acetylhexosaminidase